MLHGSVLETAFHFAAHSRDMHMLAHPQATRSHMEDGFQLSEATATPLIWFQCMSNCSA